MNPYSDAAADLGDDDTPRNRYSKAAAELADDQRTGLRAAVSASAASTPQQAATSARVAREAGLPVEIVQRNLPDVQNRLAIERVDADTRDVPTLRNRYTDPAFAALAHDDSAKLARVEQQVYGYGNALRKGVAGAKLTLDFLADRLAGAVGADRQETQRILGESAAYYKAQGSDPELAAAGQRAKEAGGGTWYGTLLNLPGEIAAADNPVDVLGKFLTEQLPASLVGFGAGVAATAPIRTAVANRIASELVAKGASTAIAGAAGNSSAVVLQALGVNYTEGLEQGLDEQQAAGRAWTKTLAEVPANAVAGAVMGLRLGPNQLTNLIGQTAAQGAGGGIGAAQASQAVGEEADPIEIALEILGEGISAGPELVGLTYSRIAQSKTVQRADAALSATEQAAQLAEAIKAADESALKARDPETFAEFVKESQPDAVLYIAPEHLEGVDLSATPEIAEQAREAQATGGDVPVSLSDVLAHLPGEQLLPNLRTDPDAMTAAEAQKFDGAKELTDELTNGPEPATLIQSPEQAGMTPDAWAAYQAAAAESAKAAVEQREARSLRDMQWLTNRTTKEAKALAKEAAMTRSVIAAEVAAELAKQPAYAARQFIKTDEGKTLPPDVVAEMFGYASGDEMTTAAATAEPLAQAVERITDERMSDEHPDIADAIGQLRSAEATISDDARVKFLATESAALAKAVGNRVLLAQEAKKYAAESIARRRVSDVRPAQFRASASRAGANAAEAFNKGDTPLAAKWKQSQVLQTAMQYEAASVKADVAKSLKLFKRMLKADDGKRDGNLTNAARAMLSQYGIANSDKTPADYLAQVKNYDPELYADLAMMMEGLPAPMPYTELAVSDFTAMRDRVNAVWGLAKSTREIEIDGQKMQLEEAAAALASKLAAEPQLSAEKMVGTNDRLDLRFRLSGMRAALRRVEFWADARDKGSAQGVFRKLIWQPVSEAVTRYRAERNKNVNKFLELLKTIEPTLKPGKIAAPELGSGVVFADRSALLHALLHTGNESNKRKLLIGYGWATEREDGSLDSRKWDGFLVRMHTEKRITKADWEFAQATWDLLESMKPAAQAAHKTIFGHYFSEITAEPVLTPFGEFKGGYVPAMTDSLLVPEAREHGSVDDMLASQNSQVFPAVGRGFTKSRVENYTRPLALDLRMIPAHIDKVTRFSVLGPTLRDSARLITRNRTFKDAMNAVDPTAIESMLVPWLKRTAQQSLTKAPETQADRAVARIANKVRNRTGLLLMSANVVNTLQQFTGLAVASLRVKPRHLSAGLMQYLRQPTNTAKAINELSPWMAQRSETGARDVDQAINELLTNPNVLQRAEQAGMKYGYALQQTAQNFLDRIVWLGAYRQAEAAGSDGAQATREADAAVRMTQSSFAPEDASKVEHAGSFTRLFLMFYSYFSGQANLLATETQNAKAAPARLALVYLMGFAVPAFMADVLAKGLRGELGGDDDDGEELSDQLLKSFFTSQARYALGMVPVAGQVGNAALGQFTPERFDDRIGASPAYSAIESTVRAPKSIVRAIEGEGNPKAAVRDGLTAVVVLTGLPVGPLVRPLGYLADEDREGVTLRGLVTGKD